MIAAISARTSRSQRARRDDSPFGLLAARRSGID
jgi:hypothetical protein